MRGFIVLAFLVAAANAGYNYGPGLSGTVGVSGLGGQSLGGSSIISSGLSGSQGIIGSNYGGGIKTIGGLSGGLSGGQGIIGSNYGGGIKSIGGLSGGLSGGQGIIGSNYGGGIKSIGGGGTTVVGIDAVDSIPQTVEYNKQVFYFSAPEEEQNEGQVTQQLSNVLKKNLQVVFIKAPENAAATNAALQLAKQAIEQRTAIYLLSKENDASQIVGQLQQIQENVPTVPEVRIIKYRTHEDLINAQATIQSQYDNFGGPSPLINGGVVPVLNYASAGSSGNVNVIGGGYSSGIGGGIGGGSSYGGGGLIGGSSYGGGGIIGGSSYGGGVTKIIGGGQSSSGGYLPPHLRK